jgi:hypothetical protein
MFLSLTKNERLFLNTAISAGVRADARTALETRLLRSAHIAKINNPGEVETLGGFNSIRFGQENGQVMVKLGQTKVVT